MLLKCLRDMLKYDFLAKKYYIKKLNNFTLILLKTEY